MARTQLTTREIGSVQRNDLDITTSGEAVIRKLIAGSNINISSTGTDAGTGDVTINAGVSGNFQLGASSAITSAYHNGSVSFHADTTQNAVRFTPGNTEGSYWKTYESGTGASTILKFQFVPRATGAVYNGTTQLDSYGSNMSFAVTGTDILRIQATGFVGIGHANFTDISSPLDIVNATYSQVKVRYDLSNYFGITTTSTGATTFGIASNNGVPYFSFSHVIRSPLTGTSSPGLDFAISDTVINARVITNPTASTDKHLYLNYNAGTTSHVKIYSDNVEVLRTSGGNLVNIYGGLTVAGDILTTTGTITAGNFSALTGSIEIANHIFGADWNGNNSAPTKNAIYDYFQTLLVSQALTDGATVTITVTAGNRFHWTGTTSRTFVVSGTGYIGQQMVIAMKNTSGSPVTHTFTAAASSWRYGTVLTALSAIPAGKTNYITAIYNPLADARWDIVSEAIGY